MPKLTDSSIKAAACPADKHRLELSDASCPGLILRVTRAGAKTFTFKYWSPLLSKTVSLALGSYPALSLAAARNKVANHRNTIAGDQDPRAEQRRERRQFARAEELTFDQLCNKYIAEYVIGGQAGAEAVQTWLETNKWPNVANPNKSSWKNDVGYLKKPRLHWGHLPANSITEDDAADLLDIIAEEAPVSANRTQSIMHTMFKWAKQPGTKARKLVTHNPISGLSQRGGKEKKRERVLTDDEIKTLWWGLDREDLPADRTTARGLKFILVTMVRPYQSAYAEVSELLNLDGIEPEYHLPPERVKRRRPVIVPLSDLACEIVDEALEDEHQVVIFPSPQGNGDVAIRRDALAQALAGKKDEKKKNGKVEDRIGIREFLGMAHFTPHDLRRTAATIARRAGAPRDWVKSMLDHINGDVTETYDMLKEKRQVVTILANEIRRIIGDGPAERDTQLHQGSVP
jgi:integrase